MFRSLAVVAVVFAVALAGTPAVGASPLAVQQVDADAVLMDVALQSDGDADWEIDYRVRLTSDNDTVAFESLADDIEANETAYTDPFGDRMRRAADSAENVTGREMAIRNVTVVTSRETVGQEYGVVTYRFEWSNFAATNGSTVRLDGALGGLYLDAETTLRLEWLADYAPAESVSPAPDEQSNTSAAWTGPREFDGDEPGLAVEPVTTTLGPTTATTTTTVGGAGGDGAVGGGPPGWLFAVVALAVLAGALALARRGAFDDLLGDDRPQDDGSASAPTEQEPGADADGSVADPEPGDAHGDDQPPELLSNEEQVLRLLEENGGRMKQQDVVSELDWTDAKTSQVIGDLREAEKVETFRLGRENVVTLPDESLI
jgi:hypothetical protein